MIKENIFFIETQLKKPDPPSGKSGFHEALGYLKKFYFKNKPIF